MNQETESLPCRLTEEELREFGQRTARAVRDVMQLEDDKKASASAFKLQIDVKKTEIRDLSVCVNSGQEWRQVVVREDRDRKESTVSIIRCDTGEVVRTRAMTPKESQGVLDLMMEDDD